MDNQNNEIDLIEVFAKLLKKIHDNKILFFSIILLFVIIGSMYGYNKKETFTYSTIAMSSIDKEVLKKTINDINKANNTNLIFKKIDDIDLEYDNSEAGSNYFKVNLILNDTTDIKQTLSDIVIVLNNITYIKEFIDNKKSDINKQINNYSSEIEKINKIQNLIFNDNTTKTAIISTNGMSKEKVEMLNKKSDFEKQLKEVRVINFVDSGYNFVVDNKNIVKSILLFLISGIFLSLIVILIKK